MNEWGLFFQAATDPSLGGSPSSPLDVTTAAELRQFIDTSFGMYADQVNAEYPAATDAVAQEVYFTLGTDYGYRCPMRDLVRAAEANGTGNAYLYSYEVGRAYHSDELLALFNVEGLSYLGGTSPSPAFDGTMRGYWTRFAATGDPNGAGDAGAPTWPAYATASDEDLVLADPTPLASANLAKAHCDFWDAFNARMAP